MWRMVWISWIRCCQEKNRDKIERWRCQCSFLVQDVQIRKAEIETNDENALHLLRGSVFYVTIQLVPETLPRSIPKTIPRRSKYDKFGIGNELNIGFITTVYLTSVLETL